MEVKNQVKNGEVKQTGMIADIQHCSIHDGPGIRTTVFLKGCPLRCAWCHNPECIAFSPQELFYPEKCIGCGQCAKGCFCGARVICGREMTAEEVMENILQDRPYYGVSGGVTFSGGEPLAQPKFLAQMFPLCRKQKIHTAVETSMYYFDRELFMQTDLIMADIKHWDEESHRKYTGVTLGRILENLKKADKLGIPMIIRTPVIPGVNDDVGTIAAISSFAAELRNVCQYELLSYHPLGNSKRIALGLKEAEFEVPSREKMEELNQYAFLR